MVLALGWAYVLYDGLSWMQAAFYGVGACVIGIIAWSAYKLTRKTIGTDGLLWLIYVASFVATLITESEIVWVFLAAGVLAWLVKAPPRFGRPAISSIALPFGIAWPIADQDTLWRVFWYFTEAGAFVFGSGLAIIPFLYGGVVREYGWLSDQQFLDAVAVALITPGPVVITVALIGFLVAGLAGASVAAVATFLPVLLVHRHSGALLQEIWQASWDRRLRRRGDGSGYWRDQRSRGRAWETHNLWRRLDARRVQSRRDGHNTRSLLDRPEDSRAVHRAGGRSGGPYRLPILALMGDTQGIC
jgi:putative chromate ion transporter